MPSDTKPIKFFIPHTDKVEAETVYQAVKKSLHSQLRLPILDRRIFSLSYINSKRRWHAEVGELEEQEGKYEILAIFESKEYIVFTRAKDGAAGPIILIAKSEVTAVVEFEATAAQLQN
jgi:hypothetical protein